MSSKKLWLWFFSCCLYCTGKAQIYPINATTQLVPPYSVYLPDYATGINNQLRVLLLNRDMTQPNYTVKLKMTIELNGTIIMRTADNFVAQPITLQPNEPYSVEGQQLAPYLNSNNIDFIGYSKQDYEQKKGLPEGAYRICFTAYDYRRPDNVKVSNEACSYYYLSKNDPPFVNLPACGIFILPYAGFQETLIEKAGRWLSYTLNIPWTNEKKAEWNQMVEPQLTGAFGSAISDEGAKSAISNAGQEFASANNIEWQQIYGAAWVELVYSEFTTKILERWNEQLMVYNVSKTVINPITGETLIDIDMATYMNIGSEPGNNANLRFSWTPRHVSSPNSTLSTMYRLELFELNPLADNAQLPAMANMTVQSTQPVFTDVTANTNYYYGPDKPALTEGKQYAWRVQAYDENGRDWFKNNGYSEVCYFTFGGIPETEIPEMEQPTDFVANAEGERRGRMNWTQSGAYTSYKVRYRKKNGTGNWFDINSDSLLARVYDLEPNTIYEAQVQGKSGAFYGPFSNLDTFKTPAPLPPPGCGVAINYAAGLSQTPLANATPYMIMKTGKFEFIVDSIGSTGAPGYYKGRGRIMSIPFLAIAQLVGQLAGNAASDGGLKVQFENIFINENREVTQGDVYAVTRPLDEWLDGWDDYYEERRREEQERHNRELFSDLDSNGITLNLHFDITNVTYDSASHTLTIFDASGRPTVITLTAQQQGHDVLINGTGRDQWLVRPDGTVHQVVGGGLYIGQNRVVSDEEINYLKQAITKLNTEYLQNEATIISDYEQKKNARKTYVNDKTSVYESYANINNGEVIKGELGRGQLTLTEKDAFAVISESFILAQHKRNILRGIKIFASNVNTKSDYEVICRSLLVKYVNLGQFIRTAKQESRPDSYIIDEIKIELEKLLDNTLQNNNY